MRHALAQVLIAWITVHTLTGQPQFIQIEQIVRVFLDTDHRTNIAMADGKVIAVKESERDVAKAIVRKSLRKGADQ